MPQRMNEERYTPEQVIAAIEAEPGGIVTNVAIRLKAHPHTIRNYAARHPEVKQALTDARERGLDLAESQLFKAIKKGQPWAITFYLRTQGKSRGYVERQEVTGIESMPVTINLNRVPRRESLDEPLRESADVCI